MAAGGEKLRRAWVVPVALARPPEALFVWFATNGGLDVFDKKLRLVYFSTPS